MGTPIGHDVIKDLVFLGVVWLASVGCYGFQEEGAFLLVNPNGFLEQAGEMVDS
jgi:hypothetical protein